MSIFRLWPMGVFSTMKMLINAWKRRKLTESWVLSLCWKILRYFLVRYKIWISWHWSIWNSRRSTREHRPHVSGRICSKCFGKGWMSILTWGIGWLNQILRTFCQLSPNWKSEEQISSPKIKSDGILGIGKTLKSSKMEPKYKKLKQNSS